MMGPPTPLAPAPTVASRRPPPGPSRLLLLEDDVALRRSYAARLRSEGHTVDEVGTLASARAALAEVAFTCLVLDRVVPDGDALDLVADLQEGPERMPVLVLSGLGLPDQRVRGLASGADDYVVKPIRLDELVQRVANLTARARSVEWGLVDLGAGVVVNRHRRRVTLDGEAVHLTPHQHSVLDYLVVHRDRLVPADELLEHCWDGHRKLFANPLHSQVNRLRRIFAGRLRIACVQGAGYVLSVDPRAPERPPGPTADRTPDRPPGASR